MGIFGKLLGTENPVKAAKTIIDQINSLESKFESFSHEQLKEQTKKWRDMLAGKEWDEQKKILDEILPEAFAAVREAAKRTLKQRHYDVQLIGSIMLHQGKVTEMRTGEGKTLTATLAIYLNALAGRGVHLVTVNDYLARRDASWMGQVYDYLGLSVSAISHEASYLYSKTAAAQSEKEEILQVDVENMIPVSRQQAYAADILYGTNNEFGFDYLRDNMAPSLKQMVQRELHYAIVDEVDSILIDEARTPLIISAPDVESTDLYREFAGFAKTLSPDDYVLEEKHRQVTYTEKGYEKLEKKYGQEIYSDIKLRHHADVALRAQTLFKLDRDYVSRGGEIIIVDEFTGRMMIGRRYSEGLHQAIEAKENVRVKQESKTLATITFQNYFRLYKKLAGMTGTAQTEAEEFHKIYKLDVVEIPTNKDMIRKDLPDSVYKSEAGKFTAIIREIKERNNTGQPMLVGTISIERNEHLSQLLKKAGVKHEVLNAKNHEREAHIIAQAGRLGAVTLATNIAGRGVDILLGGNPPGAGEAKQVREAGGLHILGTERHEARRIDNQLRGRAGRQGDPGSSQFFISLDDDLMRIFGGERVKKMMDSLGVPDDQPIENSLVSKSIENAQRKIEGFNFDTRKHVLDFDDVLNKQRETIYNRRRKILKGEIDLRAQILEKINQEITAIVSTEEDVETRIKALNTIFPLGPEFEEKVKKSDAEMLITDLTTATGKLYSHREEHLTAPLLREIEKIITLQTMDNFWMEHLDTMDHLRQSVRLRGYAQKDPLIEYKQDGLRLFEQMLRAIDRTIVYTIFRVEVKPREESSRTSAVQTKALTPEGKEIGRNDPCPCGSGKKWKKCGMLNTDEHQKLISQK
ncbi:MAG: preprotein translocase subunit SecA [Candidatus Doudnabacteria bacterium RIFCSPHIGHO2_02_FULL_48_21]|uniref:Protein translocase subunit SecA n=1 Tax=Candidatus Doudnabacteria bacterium RIFCSPLOWO2_02_FULL_48_13 TaxID=1817845 RepID=A0A1F5QB43_9BACT|nr:MAG: preprotein translocase subunit SecA [Candidatus Doudnabacteria bacterium RIFCSPHIGHO2_01_FULL_48_180]OGE91844.1 MAG: preprotein translocase subunit SecA [Candidatus Doudnabacteria bacterium RIFCSPHIGHO2_12_FULL_47_25]OGE94081.1 MAG: preprotein translocase subunit SecA [Candidatus Doudnabacteria bacterium RIFCSPHIGHO2_02_FULL_48_21]OGE98213.1 MAG: preprotein translocase subunit SecA [Candidatus Doudnabacteria bacterium RIFCSPLOWO2_01_FULL_48_57]OGE99112.1 MAG: preprotein translocase subu